MKTGYKVGDVMTHKPISVVKDVDIKECAKVMAENHVGALLIAEEQKIEGILSEQDIVRKSVAEGKNPLEMKASDIMEFNIVDTSPDEDIHDALKTMGKLNIRHLPVIEDEKLVGLITMKDILKMEPHLFELIAHKIELREEENKPINNHIPNEGICNLCGEYTKDLKSHENLVVCPSCAMDSIKS